MIKYISRFLIFLVFFVHFQFSTVQAQVQPSLKVISDWGAGFCTDIVIVNSTQSAISWDSVEFTLVNPSITSSWNGDFTINNSIIKVTPHSWNRTLQPNASAQIGFCGQGNERPKDIGFTNNQNTGNTPTPGQTTSISLRPAEVQVSEGDMKLKSVVTSDWGTGYCREISLQNTSSTQVYEGWKILFQSSNKIMNWSSVKGGSGNQVSLEPESWNKQLLPGNTTSIGFCADGLQSDSNWQVFGTKKETNTTPTNPTPTVPTPPVTPVNPPTPTPVVPTPVVPTPVVPTPVTPTPVTPPPVVPTPVLPPQNGICGPEHNKILSSTPTLLCDTGTASSFQGAGPWSWTCNGINGGTKVLCKAELLVEPTPIVNGDTLEILISASKNRKPISPYIYGGNWGFSQPQNLGSKRLGGNRMTGYNWENNASNAGSDWIHSSDSYLSSSSIPNNFVEEFHKSNQANNIGYSLVTVPMAGYVAKDKFGSVFENEQAPSNRWVKVVAEKGSPLDVVPNSQDSVVYVDEFIASLTRTFGKSTASGAVRGYALDNEPALWNHTHPRIHPNKPTVESVISKSIITAKSIKNIDSNAEIFGGNTFGFSENWDFLGATDWNQYKTKYPTYIDAYLGELKKASDASGKRLLDVFSFHWYPEAQGKDNNGNKVRVTETNSDTDVAFARMQAPRALWDETYTEDSWIGQWFAKDAYPVIPKIQQSILTQYPQTKISLGEFNFGAPQHISGGIATADALGIFGKQGIYLATHWGDINGYTASAYNLFRNPDGSNKSFGSLSIFSSKVNPATTSVYASVSDVGGNADVIVINKSTTPQKVFIKLEDISSTGGKAFYFDSQSQSIKTGAPFVVKNGGVEYILHATSVTRLIFDGTSIRTY